MEKGLRSQKIEMLYKNVSKSSVHVEFKERLKFLCGWSGQKISATLKRVCTYSVDHPCADLSRVYCGAFGIRYHGEEVSDVTKEDE
jgi:hypothetical protein